ncbi:hypothetical protein ZHAS_00004719 [Anopheles sinensis]|uniref:Uncharacterized protein n=1 Tax=Anopheles sinensis TaxID=74873 RepID=A0A084VHQ3_ANOSI|nr:hypothetical protein ZHAS_00004719 [Anopheles sinensis]
MADELGITKNVAMCEARAGKRKIQNDGLITSIPSTLSTLNNQPGTLGLTHSKNPQLTFLSARASGCCSKTSWPVESYAPSNWTRTQQHQAAASAGGEHSFSSDKTKAQRDAQVEANYGKSSSSSVEEGILLLRRLAFSGRSERNGETGTLFVLLEGS